MPRKKASKSGQSTHSSLSAANDNIKELDKIVTAYGFKATVVHVEKDGQKKSVVTLAQVHPANQKLSGKERKKQLYHMKLGEIAEKIKRYQFEQAREIIRDTSQWENNADLLAFHSQIFSLQGQYHEGYQWALRAVKLDPKDQVLIYLAGTFLSAMHRPLDLLALLDTTNDWEHVDQLSQLAYDCLKRMNLLHLRPSLEANFAAIIKKQLYPGPLIAQAISQLIMGEDEQAEKSYLTFLDEQEKELSNQKLLNKPADQIQKTQTNIWYGTEMLARMYFKQHKYRKAQEYYLKTNHRVFDNATYRTLVGAAYLSGNHTRANVGYRVMMGKVSPSEFDYRDYGTYLALQNDAQALDIAARAKHLFPTFHDEFDVISASYYYHSDIDKSILILEFALQANPFSIDVYHNLMMCYLVQNKLNEANQLLIKAKNVLPQYGLLHEQLQALIESPVAEFSHIFKSTYEVSSQLQLKYTNTLTQIFQLFENLGQTAFLHGSALYNVVLSQLKKDHMAVNDFNFLILCEDPSKFSLEGFTKMGDEFLKAHENQLIRVNVMTPLEYRKNLLVFKKRIPITMLLGRSNGEIIDPTGMGLDDLEHRFIRVIGDAEKSLKDDPLLAAFIYRYLLVGFSVEPTLTHALTQWLKKGASISLAPQVTPIDKAVAEVSTATTALKKLPSSQEKAQTPSVAYGMLQWLREKNSVQGSLLEIQKVQQKKILEVENTRTQNIAIEMESFWSEEEAEYDYEEPFEWQQYDTQQVLDPSQASESLALQTHYTQQYYTEKGGIEYPVLLDNHHFILEDSYLNVIRTYQKNEQFYVVDDFGIKYPCLSTGQIMYEDKHGAIKTLAKIWVQAAPVLFAPTSSDESKQVLFEEAGRELFEITRGCRSN